MSAGVGKLPAAPYGLYLHIPFCASKCCYCDFLSFPGLHQAWKRRYVEALATEIRHRVDADWQQPQSIFIGGGTPTSLSLADLETVLQALENALGGDTPVEYTVEVNPGSASDGVLALLKRYGVNRLSFGVQSMDDAVLRSLGRQHRAADVVRAVSDARKMGFANINLDLIYGLPAQTKENWRNTLSQALDLQPQHLSLYQLIIEPGTAMSRALDSGQLPPVDEDVAADIWEMNLRDLPAHGFAQYEISNYALPGYECIHNQLYWELQNYLGLGLGATGWKRPVRTVNTDDLSAYCNHWLAGKPAPQHTEQVEWVSQMQERIMMSLRMNRGLDHEDFRAHFEVTPEEAFGAAFAQSQADGTMVRNARAWQLTEKGRRLGNVVLARFF